MARTKKDDSENKIDPSAVQSTIQNELMKELLSEAFDDETMKVNNEGLSLVIEVAKCLVTETCQQASSSAEHTHKVGMTQVEKCLTQTVNKKIKVYDILTNFLSSYMQPLTDIVNEEENAQQILDSGIIEIVLCDFD